MSVPCVLLLHAKLFVLSQVLPHAAHLPPSIPAVLDPALSDNTTNRAFNSNNISTNNSNNNHKGRRSFLSLYNGRLVLWLRSSFFWHDSISKRVSLVLEYLGGLLLFFDHHWPTPKSSRSDLPVPNTETVPTNVPTPEPFNLVDHGAVPKSEPESRHKVRCNPDPLGPSQLSNRSLTNPFLMNDSIYGTPFSPAWTAMYRYFIPSPPHNHKVGDQVSKRLNPDPSVLDRTADDDSRTTIAGEEVVVANETINEPANGTNLEHCVLYFYYHKSCPYSAHVAPEINALPRLFPQIFVLAIDTKKYWNHSIKYGLMFVPNLVLLKGKSVVANFEGTMNTQNIITFITNHTDLQPIAGEHVLVEEDYRGPVPTQMVETNPVTYLCWLFIGIVLLKYLIINRDRLKPKFHDLLYLVKRNHAHLHAD